MDTTVYESAILEVMEGSGWVWLDDLEQDFLVCELEDTDIYITEEFEEALKTLCEKNVLLMAHCEKSERRYSSYHRCLVLKIESMKIINPYYPE